MNNSLIAKENVETADKTDFLEREMGKLSQIVEAINRVEASEDWKKLKSLVLDGVVESLKKGLVDEASKRDVDTAEIYRLQGQLLWANKYADLKEFSKWYVLQIENIKKLIKHEENPRDGAL